MLRVWITDLQELWELGPLRWLAFIVTLAGFRVTVEIDPWECV